MQGLGTALLIAGLGGGIISTVADHKPGKIFSLSCLIVSFCLAFLP